MQRSQDEIVKTKSTQAAQPLPQSLVRRLPSAPHVARAAGRVSGNPDRNAHATALNRMIKGSPSHAGELLVDLQTTCGNRYVQRVLALARQGEVMPDVQRQDDARTTTTTAGGPSPADAPPVFTEDFDPIPEDGPQTVGSSTGSGIQTKLQRTADSSLPIQRQPAPARPPPTPIVAPTLNWSNFAPVPNRIGGMSAQTGMQFTWRSNGTGFNAVFNPATSWSVVADQTPALLRHEQYHLKLAVLIANKANAMQAAGGMSSRALIAAFKRANAVHTRSYDGDTDHSRNTRMQTLWEQDIDQGMPQFPVT